VSIAIRHSPIANRERIGGCVPVANRHVLVFVVLDSAVSRFLHFKQSSEANPSDGEKLAIKQHITNRHFHPTPPCPPSLPPPPPPPPPSWLRGLAPPCVLGQGLESGVSPPPGLVLCALRGLSRFARVMPTEGFASPSPSTCAPKPKPTPTPRPLPRPLPP
jgi:hypothetical protein